MHVCVSVWFPRWGSQNNDKHLFLVCFSSGSNVVYSNITFTGIFLVSQFNSKGNCLVCLCAHLHRAACPYLGVIMCAIEYAHCTQPALGEDPFSHQIFTNKHRHLAGCCCNAHTHCCVMAYWYIQREKIGLGKLWNSLFHDSFLKFM